MFYIFIDNGKINGCGQTERLDDNVINYEVEEDFYNQFAENPTMYIWDIENQKVIENPSYEEEQTKARKKEFESKFFEIPAIENIFKGGWYRRQPKGYSSAVESITTADSICTKMNGLPANILTFYTSPDFSDESQCTEEWLLANQFKNENMTVEQFAQFYITFITAWNNQEHETTKEE